MSEATRRGVKEGIGFGIIAGIIFAVMEVIGATLMGDHPLMPFRMFASVVLGQAVLEPTTPLSTALMLGGAAHLFLSGLFGLAYALVVSRLSVETRTNWGREAMFGLVFGAAVYFVNFQVIARLAYPWFLMAPQGLQLLMHAMFFGLPLGLMYSGAERRAYHVAGAPSPVTR